MFIFRGLFTFIFLLHVAVVDAGDPEDLVFKSGFERCDNFTIPDGALVWDGGGDGVSWSDAANWQGNVLPTDNDSVAIGDEGGITVIYDNSAGTTIITDLDICENLKISGGTLQINGTGVTRSDFELSSSGTLIVEGQLLARRLLQSNSSTLEGSGTVTVAGKYTWQQGTQRGSGETIFNGGIDFTTNAKTLRERTLTINGASTWTGGGFSLQLGATIDNNSTLDIQTDDDMNWGSNPDSLFRNDGTITKSAGSDITSISANFINNSTIAVESGELQLGRNTAGETSSGTFTVSNGAFIGFRGNHDMSAASFTGAGGFHMVGGNGTSTIGNIYTLAGPLKVSGGAASFIIPITVSDDVTVTGGVLELNGATTINGNVSLTGSGDIFANAATPVSGTFLQTSGSILDGTGVVTVAGKYTWQQGTQRGSGETIFNGGIDFTTNAKTLRERTLTINGASTWTGGGFSLQLGATIDNNSTLDIQTDDDMNWGSNPDSLFRNDGTITKSAGSDITSISANFINNSTIAVESGELQLGRNTAGETSSGTFTVSNGAFIGFRGNHDMSGASFTGAGGFHMVGGNGTSTIGNIYTLAGPLKVSGGAASFIIPITVSDDVTVTGGVLELNGATTINGNVSLTGSGDIFANAATPVSGTFLQTSGSILDGTGVVTVAGKYTWQQGTQRGSGETIFNGGIDFTTNAKTLRERTLTINGASTWTGGGFSLQLGATIDNNSTLDIQTDDDMNWGSNPDSLFRNDGTITKSAGSDITSISANFINNSTIAVESGELQLGRNTAGETSSGTFTVSNGAFIGFRGNHDMSGASFTGAGGFHMVGGNGTSTIGNIYTLAGPLKVSGGAASFIIPITVSDDVTVTGGVLELNGATTINGNVSLTGSGDIFANAATPVSGTFLQTSGSILDGTGVVTVAGKYTWQQGTQRGSGETIFNGGIDFTTNAKTLRERTLTINGASTWTGGGFSLQLGATIDNNSTLDIQTDDDMNWGSNPLSLFRNDGVVTKTSGNAVTSISANFVNAGDLSAATGSIELKRAFTQESTGTLHVDITSDTVFDVFAITDAATLDGTLDINRDGGYTPTDVSPATNFEILTASSVSGTFSSITDQSIGNGFEFAPVYGATNVELDVVAE